MDTETVDATSDVPRVAIREVVEGVISATQEEGTSSAPAARAVEAAWLGRLCGATCEAASVVSPPRYASQGHDSWRKWHGHLGATQPVLG